MFIFVVVACIKIYSSLNSWLLDWSCYNCLQLTEMSRAVSDGSTLPTLIEILAGESIADVVDSRSLSSAQKLSNIANSIDFLRSKGLALPEV